MPAQSAEIPSAAERLLLARPGPWLGVGGAAVLLVLVAAVFLQVRGHDFVNFDDPMYITENGQVTPGLSWDGFKWAWTNKQAMQWQPLAWIAHMTVVSWAGLEPGVHLLVNVAVHALNALLLWWGLTRFTRLPWRSLVVALVFAVHPVNVETVAWASQLKSTLSTTMLLLTLGAYHAYARGGGRRFYVYAFVAHAVGLLAKPMLVSMPALLLALDFWPLRRGPGQDAHPGLRRWILEKVPFFLVSAAIAAVTMIPFGDRAYVHTAGRISPMRLAYALENGVDYLRLLVFPRDLAVLYPEATNGSPGKAGLAVALVVGISVCAWRVRRRWPALLAGWLWFLAALLPVSGFVPIGPHSMADRYMYVPAIGLFVAAVWLAAEWSASVRRSVAMAVAIGVIGLLAWRAERQVNVWTNSLTLWAHARETAPPCAVTHQNYGHALLAAGRLAEAEGELRRGSELLPHDSRPRVNLALLAARRGDAARAVELLEEAARLAPRDARIYSNQGSLLHDLGRGAEAEATLRRAIAIEPTLAEAHLNLGVVLATSGRPDEARASFLTAARLRPHDPRIVQNLALLDRQTRR